MSILRLGLLAMAAVAFAGLAAAGAAAAQPKKPNIVVIWGDDVGFTNLSIYSRGVMGYRTPNIDRIAKEGVVFTDHYAHRLSSRKSPPFTARVRPVLR